LLSVSGTGTLTLPCIEDAIKQLPQEDAEVVPESVFIAWCNDMVLGTYRTGGAAQRRCDKYRSDNALLTWTWVPGTMRWSAPGVARLEVEEFSLQ
jgi:hypothetical protein